MLKQRGVILAGGTGSRLGELTKVTNKHLLPIGNEPMIYHPIKKLVGAGIDKITIVTGKEHAGDFIELLGSGKNLKCDLTYKVQEAPGGIAQALGLAEPDNLDTQTIVLLGDNIFQQHLRDFVKLARKNEDKAGVFIQHRLDNHRFGVPKFDCYKPGNLKLPEPAKVESSKIVKIIEKPVYNEAPSHYAVLGIYFYPPDVYDVIRQLKPSKRNELEITDVNNYYVSKDRLVHRLIRGYWTDAGTLDTYQYANQDVTEEAPSY